jgi:hypothetical protein
MDNNTTPTLPYMSEKPGRCRGLIKQMFNFSKLLKMETKFIFGTRVLCPKIGSFVFAAVLLFVMAGTRQGVCQEVEINNDDVLLKGKNGTGNLSILAGGETLVQMNDAMDWRGSFYVKVPQNLSRAISVFQTWGNVVFEVYGDGTAYTKGVVVTSDSTAKKDIRQLESQMDKIKKVKGVSYQWKEEKEAGIKGSKRTYGVIAQDIEKIYPDMVFTNQKGEKGVYYHELTIVLLEAVKEQQAQIEKQQSAIETQTRLLIDLEKRMLKLEKKENETSK